MPIMISEVYDAFRGADVGEDISRKAAEALAGYDNRFIKIEGRLDLLMWMVGASIALNVAILTRMLLH
jgi:hypothetical protein